MREILTGYFELVHISETNGGRFSRFRAVTEVIKLSYSNIMDKIALSVTIVALLPCIDNSLSFPSTEEN